MMDRGHSDPIGWRNQATLAWFRFATASGPTRISRSGLLWRRIVASPLVHSVLRESRLDKAIGQAYLAVTASIEGLNYDTRDGSKWW